MIQSVDRAARILHELGSGSPTLGVTEIGARLDLAKPTVHGLLRTLEQSGLVSQDVATGRYSLGPRVLQLGNAYLAGSELRSRSMLRAGSLARQVNEAVWVSRARRRCRDGGAPRVPAGRRGADPRGRGDDPVARCALGQAIVAAMPAAEVDALVAAPLRALTGRTRTAPDAVRKALAVVADKGSRSRTRRPTSATAASRPPSSTTAAGRSARWAWSAPRNACSSGRPGPSCRGRCSRRLGRSPATWAPPAGCTGTRASRIGTDPHAEQVAGRVGPDHGPDRVQPGRRHTERPYAGRQQPRERLGVGPGVAAQRERPPRPRR